MKRLLINISTLLFTALFAGAALAGCELGGGTTEPPKGSNGSDSVKSEHTDADGDGLCDDCGIKVNVALTFLAVNDLHGKFMDTDSQPGLDEFTTYIKNLYADTTREEILLSSGDMWQGTAESSSTRGALMTEWMNEAGFVSMTLGNHEFDWGPSTLLPNSELADFPILGINVTYQGKMPDYCKPSVVVERAGAKIGIIGAIGNCLSSISGEFQSGLSFTTGSALTALVKSEADRLRNEEGCDFIVYSIHDGGDGFNSSGVNSVKNSDMSWYDSSLSNGYVDLVFEAHTHQRYILRDEYGVYHLQAGGENKYVSSVNVTLDLTTGSALVTPSILPASKYAASNLADDPSVQRIFEKYFEGNDPYATIGYNASSRNSTTIVNQVARLYYDKGVDEWGEQYTISAGGGFLNARSPYKISAGNVSYADIFSVLPFDNSIVLGKMRGTDFAKFLDRQNATSNPYHIYTTVKSAEVDSSKEYYVIVDTYTSTYRYNNITEVARIENVYARDLLADYIKAGNWTR